MSGMVRVDSLAVGAGLSLGLGRGEGGDDAP